MKKIKNYVAANWPPEDARISRLIRIRLNQAGSPDKILFEEIDKAYFSKKPLLVGRLGGTEARVIGSWLRLQERINGSFYSVTNLIWPGPYKKRARQLKLGAGFYPTDQKSIDLFVKNYNEIIPKIDILGAWGTAFAWPESLVNNSVPIIPLESLSPWIEPWENKFKDIDDSSENQLLPWSFVLKNKKILVITPFADTAAYQLKNIQKIFNGNFPKLNIKFLKSPMTMGGLTDGSTWFSQLKDWKQKIEQFEFDIALVSAGSYSLPLAEHVKKIGKIGIHTGGALQLFFGIIGRRWEKEPWVTRRLNDYWVRPSQLETPRVALKVENGCYW